MSGRVLVVDDVATNRMILHAKLSAEYFDVILADSGEMALEKIARDQPDVVLLDVVMPGIDGYEVCRQIKADPKSAHVPVIMLTAHFGEEERLRGLECGADDFLCKPVNDLALFARVRNLTRVKFMLDELRLRNSIAVDFGLGDPAIFAATLDDFTGHILVAAPSVAVGRKWLRMVQNDASYTFEIVTDEDQIDRCSQHNPPDIYLINSKIGRNGDGLRLVSRLRSRPETRHALIIFIVPNDDLVLASKGLDLGASDYLFAPLNPQELVLRLQSQMRRKLMSDRLRNAVQDRLRLAVVDPLTGLYNRRYATEHLAKVSDRAAKSGKPFALMVLDIDNFKSVNDRFGHSAGDRVLKEFAARIQENMRGVDMVSRLGGEEFLVAMPDTTKEEARVAGERLRRLIEQDRFRGRDAGHMIDITVSIGVALGGAGSVDVSKLLQDADQALYASKAEGRNQVTMHSSAA